MSSRLVDLCLLAYPRARRRRDRDYLRDLALELAERQGLGRQAISLLLGGLRERVAGAGKRTWRIGAVSLVGVALAFVATAFAAQGNHESYGFSCVSSAVGAGHGCTGAGERLLSAHERAGWHCTTSKPLADTDHRANVECTRDG